VGLVRSPRFAIRGAAIAILLVISSAGAQEVPSTAVSTSLAAPPIVLEHLALVFEFPQEATGFPQQVFGSLDTSFGRVFGATFPADHDAWFVLSSRDGDYFSRHQAGWATERGGLRLGIAVRGGLDVSSNKRTEDGTRTSSEEFRRERRELEAAVGLGFGVSTTIDLAVSVRRSEIFSSFEAHVRRGADELDQIDILDGAPLDRINVSARARTRLTPHVSLIGAGRWVGRGQEIEVTSSFDQIGFGDDPSYDRVSVFERRGGEWLAVIGVETSTSPSTRILATGQLGTTERWQVETYSPIASRFRTTTSSLSAGAAHQIGAFTGYLGTSAMYSRSERDAWEWDPSMNNTDSRSETFTTHVVLGAQARWRRFHVAGSLDRSDLWGELFSRLDVHVDL
jgi:hypothetical protein